MGIVLVSSLISLFSLGLFNHCKPRKCEIKLLLLLLLLLNPERKSSGFKNIRMHVDGAEGRTTTTTATRTQHNNRFNERGLGLRKADDDNGYENAT